MGYHGRRKVGGTMLQPRKFSYDDNIVGVFMRDFKYVYIQEGSVILMIGCVLYRR